MTEGVETARRETCSATVSKHYGVNHCRLSIRATLPRINSGQQRVFRNVPIAGIHARLYFHAFEFSDHKGKSL